MVLNSCLAATANIPEANQMRTLDAATAATVDTRSLGAKPTNGCAVSNRSVYVLDEIGSAHALTGTLVDTDGDGDAEDLDCAPSDPAVHHGVIEICNAIDDNFSDSTVPGAANPVTCSDARCTANGNSCQ